VAASLIAVGLAGCPKNDPVMAIYAGPPPELAEEPPTNEDPPVEEDASEPEAPEDSGEADDEADVPDEGLSEGDAAGDTVVAIYAAPAPD
jgi:hypothetical protein